MGLFSSILDKLGIGSAKAAPVPEAAPEVEIVQPGSTVAPPGPADAAAEPSAPQPIAVVDVVSQLEAKAAAHPQKLNWKTSIVDLLKLLDIDSSYAFRKDLARELGCPDELMADSAQMNMWLHKTVLQKVADNGGNIPADLLG